uniref:Protein kinase domain-containing protein n=1 Tax=Chromera velia CCMP2878 TaxID=1169474 RepID=A0A0G4H7S3_9ALVE|eukprot:Cvel_24987.t1-p1 / transcript=Cvel_24987.t1 / gene=Cvel_24987 / organism=Chromera_velia_CCMP2878 / gene_product=Mitogen-activated protein kinase 1, putative / transcript_product=Mitogen-activated protein kinase 1, putative / location=Cvel_scaffold2769:9620-13032(+) / protein_length=588 / sequence_SO=supercontig / SO=protein_coding / is_pseudo=false
MPHYADPQLEAEEAFMHAERYRRVSSCGECSYGQVTQVEDTLTGRQVALKHCRDVFQSSAVAKRTLREIQILTSLGGHENILKLSRVYISKRIGKRKVPLKCLSDLPLTQSGTGDFSGIDVCKPRNLLVNSNCDLQISDFGMARIFTSQERACELPCSPPVSPTETKVSGETEIEEGMWERDDGGVSLMTEYVQTRWYRAPEVLCGFSQYTDKIDVWSLGCIMAELITRKPVFRGSGTRDQLLQIVKVLGKPMENEFLPQGAARTFIRQLSEEPTNQEGRKSRLAAFLRPHMNTNDHPHCLDLLARLLAFSPDERPTVGEILKHPFFSAAHDPNDEPAGTPVQAELFQFEAFPSFFGNQHWPLPQADCDRLVPISVRGTTNEGQGEKITLTLSATLKNEQQKALPPTERVEAATAGHHQEEREDEGDASTLPQGLTDTATEREYLELKDPRDKDAYVERLHAHPLGAFLERMIRTAETLEEAERRSLSLLQVTQQPQSTNQNQNQKQEQPLSCLSPAASPPSSETSRSFEEEEGGGGSPATGEQKHKNKVTGTTHTSSVGSASCVTRTNITTKRPEGEENTLPSFDSR